MPSRLQDIKEGSATINDLVYWINERHLIYIKRFEKELLKPWTEDEIFQQYKFTNVFRQLDKGTLALKEMLLRRQIEDPALLFFNIVWYRLFNWHEHAKELGFCRYQTLKRYIEKCFRTHKKIFTGAHMTTGRAYEYKHTTYLKACQQVWSCRHEFTQELLKLNTMEAVFEKLLGLFMIGRFVAYELVCDLRFTAFLDQASDKLTWANMGPGAQRGLKRLGLPHKNQQKGLESMIKIYNELINKELINHHVAEHLPFHDFHLESPFELREVEHSLCEFDKYQRVKMGEGRPRSRYNGIN